METAAGSAATEYTDLREIVIDTETTGLDPQAGHRIVELAMVELVNLLPTGRTWHAYFCPGRAMTPEAQAVHGLTDEFLADKLLFTEHAAGLLGFVGDAPIVAHNARFDMGFLNMELKRSKQPGLENDVVDTLALARKQFPGRRASLDALCDRFKIDRSSRLKHGALLDAELMAEVYLQLSGGRQRGMAVTVEPVVRPQPVMPFRPARPHAATPRELALHRLFLKSYRSVIWP